MRSSVNGRIRGLAARVKGDRMLDEVASTLDFTQALVGERCGVIESMCDPSLLGGFNPPVLKVPGLMRIGFADMLDYMTDGIEAAELPPA